MPKKTYKQYQDDIKLIVLKWEFIRRNTSYINDYKKYIVDKRKNELKKVWNKKSIDWEIYFYEKYFVLFPIDPDMSHLNKKSADLLNRNSLFVKSLSHVHKSAHYVTSDRNIGLYSNVEKLSKNQLKKKLMIDVLINIEAPLTQILLDVESIVREWQELRGDVEKIKPNRVWCKEQEQCLEIYDLNIKQKWSVDRIAKKYFKGDWNRDKQYARQKTRRQIRKCQFLVVGGYMQIR